MYDAVTNPTIKAYCEYYRYATAFIISSINNSGVDYQDRYSNYDPDILKVTEHLLDEASNSRFTIQQALSPIVFMDHMLRVGKCNILDDGVYFPVNLFILADTPLGSGDLKFSVRTLFSDYIVTSDIPEYMAFTNDWYIRVGFDSQYTFTIVEPFGGMVENKCPSIDLDWYAGKLCELDVYNKPYHDPFGVLTQIHVTTTRIKSKYNYIQVNGDNLTTYLGIAKRNKIYDSAVVPRELQKAMFMQSIVNNPILSNTIVIV